MTIPRIFVGNRADDAFRYYLTGDAFRKVIIRID